MNGTKNKAKKDNPKEIKKNNPKCILFKKPNKNKVLNRNAKNMNPKKTIISSNPLNSFSVILGTKYFHIKDFDKKNKLHINKNI